MGIFGGGRRKKNHIGEGRRRTGGRVSGGFGPWGGGVIQERPKRQKTPILKFQEFLALRSPRGESEEKTRTGGGGV